MRASGHSDDEIWAMAASVDDASWPEDPPPGKEKEYYLSELINDILILSDKVLNEEHPPFFWIEAGIRVSILLHLATQDDQAKDDFLQRQRASSKLPRNRIASSAKLVVEHVLSNLPSGAKPYTFFEEYVGADRIVVIDKLEIEVCAVSDDEGKVIKYGFEKPGAGKPDWYAQSSIRSIIFRLKNQG